MAEENKPIEVRFLSERYVDVKDETGKRKTEKVLQKDSLLVEFNDIYCVFCGEKKVYTECGEGDYYVGAASYCVGCGSKFTYQLGNDADARLLEGLREATRGDPNAS